MYCRCDGYSCYKWSIGGVCWLYSQKAEYSKFALSTAIINGYLPIVKFICENGLLYDNYAISFAEHNGHLEVVNYLKENPRT